MSPASVRTRSIWRWQLILAAATVTVTATMAVLDPRLSRATGWPGRKRRRTGDGPCSSRGWMTRSRCATPRARTRAARELTSDPVWRAAEHLPWAGPQLAAVATVASAIDDVASDALTPLSEVAASFSLDALRPVDGRIDLAAFTSIEDAAVTGADGLAHAAASVDAIDRSPLLAPVRDGIDEVGTLLESTAQTTDALARATALLPAMLGADGPRNYLVVFQNNAEWRSLGGIVGAMSMIHTEDGTLQLAAQGSSSDFARYDEPVLDLGPDLTGIYGARPAKFIQNVTQVPDFSVTGALAREMWLRETGTAVDGRLSVPAGWCGADRRVDVGRRRVRRRVRRRPSGDDVQHAAGARAGHDSDAHGAAGPSRTGHGGGVGHADRRPRRTHRVGGHVPRRLDFGL